MQNTQLTQSTTQVTDYKNLFKHHNSTLLRSILDTKGFDVNSYVSFYEGGNTMVTLLHLAVTYNWTEGAQLLLEKGAKVDVPAYSTNRTGRGSPIDWAESNGKQDWVLWLEEQRSGQQAAQSASSRLGR